MTAHETTAHDESDVSGESAEGDVSGEAVWEPVMLLDHEGVRRPSASHPECDAVADELSDADLLDLYRELRVVRRIDDEATALQRQGELGLWPPLRGQEAAQLGSARAIGDADFVFPSYRENGVAYARGVAPVDLVRAWRGSSASGWDPYEHRMANPQVIIAAQSLHATGWAMGALIDGEPGAAIAYFGDGATSEGDLAEALVFAASFAAPVVFFCQNNHWAISEPVAVQSRTPLAGRGSGFGVPSARVDGNDVLAVYAATRLALERARSGGGPTLIEAVTYRMGPHTTADDPTRYRDAAELEFWATRDPISRLGAFLRTRGVLTDEAEAEVERRADAVAHEFREACIGIPDPGPLELFDHVYAEPHPLIERERADYERYLAGFADESADETSERSEATR